MFNNEKTKNILWGPLRCRFINERRANEKVSPCITESKKLVPPDHPSLDSVIDLKINDILTINFLEFRSNGKKKLTECKFQLDAMSWLGMKRVSKGLPTLMKGGPKWAPQSWTGLHL